MKTYADRLEWAMTCAGLNPRTDQSELARRVGEGVKPQTIQYLLNHDKNAKSSRYTPQIATALGCDVMWLTNGSGQAPTRLSKHISATTDISKKEEISGIITSIPVSKGTTIGKDDEVHRRARDAEAPRTGDNFTAGPGLRTRLYPEISWVQAGMWTEIAENFVPTDEVQQYPCHIDLGPDGYVLRVEGLSMTAPPGVMPTFPPGFLLYVRPHEDAVPGKCVIVRRNGNTATFKRLTMVDGELYLEALNPDWPNRYIKLQADDEFCGVVMHAGFDL
ncbi:S24 family peptidase [Paraburkholderia sp. RL18-085-BIA-A]|uniref:S24 family peptidase n=1 Tax=Paraburkholderia sp. RL18-085-BIA-A TaxID=3031633 RepID=UPI0038BDC824